MNKRRQRESLRLVHVITSFLPERRDGGPVVVVDALCRGLAERGHRVRVLCARRALAEAEDHGPPRAGYTVEAFAGYGGRRLSPGLLRALPAAFRWADLVHVSGVYEPHVPAAFALARAQGRPLVWSPHGSLLGWRDERRRWLKAGWRGLCRLLAKDVIVHAASDSEAGASEGHRVRVIPHGVAGEQLPFPSASGPLRLLAYGRLDVVKGFDLLLRACQRLACDYQLTVAGDGPDADRLHVLARELGVAVRFVGWQDRPEQVMREAELVVVPSHRESFGMVVAEALACGRPVVASRQTPWRELAQRDCGWWVDNTPAALAMAITAANERRDQLEEMGARGHAWMGEQAWSRSVDEMLATYREALG